MRNLIIGLLLGIGLTLSASALAGDDTLKITGSGRMTNTEVIGVDGKRACIDPYYYGEGKVVHCEK